MLGPNPRVHSSETGPAWSLALDLRLHFTFVFVASRNLMRTILKIIGDPDRDTPTSQSFRDEVRTVAQRLAAFSRIIFPGEEKQAFPSVAVRDVTGRDVVRVSYPSDIEAPRLPAGPFAVSVSYPGDGVTDFFGLPFADLAPAT